MEGMTRTIVPWSTKTDQATPPSVVAEIAMYIDANVKAQFAANMHVVSVSVRAECRIVAVNRRELTSTVVEPSPVS